MKTPYSVVFTTVASRTIAHEIAKKLIAERLAACVQMLPIESIYTWKNEIVEDNEILLLIKTREDRYPELENAILALHPYEVPEIVQVAVDNGLPAYLGWIDEVT